jgi:sugar phosphate isomerase/epimerase
MMLMELSAMLTSLPLDFAPAVRQVKEIGFTHVDIVATTERAEGDAAFLADAGLWVSCASVGRGLPEEQTLDAASAEVRRAALDAMKLQIADAARLGARDCYIVPGEDASKSALLRFSDACGLLADYAAGRMVQLCVEHVPGRALATAAAVLEWLDAVKHPNLALLLDVGHCLISGENCAEMVGRAEERLGHVHFDDNDGVGDLHWPLLTGQLTRATLLAFGRALQKHHYDGNVALELNPQNPDPVQALRQSRHIIQELGAFI